MHVAGRVDSIGYFFVAAYHVKCGSGMQGVGDQEYVLQFDIPFMHWKLNEVHSLISPSTILAW
jgi:hypothetical protein